MHDLKGRSAVVIGGGSGIGRGIALVLAAEGVRVLVGDLDKDNADETAEEIVRRGGTAAATLVDATDRGSLAEAATVALEELGNVHILVNTVGVVTSAGVSTSDEKVWAWFIEFHLMATVRVVDAFLPLLESHDEGGHIVLTSSLSGLKTLSAHTDGTSTMNTGVYTVLKHAVTAYGEMLGQELAGDGIGVSVLCPGAVDTNIGTTSARHRPARFGGPLPTRQPAGGHRRPSPGAMLSEDVGRVVVRGIEADRTFILTHPETVDVVRDRQQRILDDFAFFTSNTSIGTSPQPRGGDVRGRSRR